MFGIVQHLWTLFHKTEYMLKQNVGIICAGLKKMKDCFSQMLPSLLQFLHGLFINNLTTELTDAKTCKQKLALHMIGYTFKALTSFFIRKQHTWTLQRVWSINNLTWLTQRKLLSAIWHNLITVSLWDEFSETVGMAKEICRKQSTFLLL